MTLSNRCAARDSRTPPDLSGQSSEHVPCPACLPVCCHRISAGLLRAFDLFLSNAKMRTGAQHRASGCRRERDNACITHTTQRTPHTRCLAHTAGAAHWSLGAWLVRRCHFTMTHLHDEVLTTDSTVIVYWLSVCVCVNVLFVQQTCIAATKNKNSNIFTRRPENNVHMTHNSLG